MNWKKWRIVTDEYLGYEVQYRWIFWPFWLQHDISNTHLTIESAKRQLERAKHKVVYTEAPNGQR